MSALYIKNTITISAPAEKVWKALVDPEETKKYMFGCEAISDWKPGSPLLWTGTYEGKEMIVVKGHVIEIQPLRRLVYSVIDSNSTIPDIPENYLHVTYTLTAQNEQTELTVTQGNYATVAEGERRYKETYNNGLGWMPILEAIKKQVEES